jgi:hypothetical protein
MTQKAFISGLLSHFFYFWTEKRGEGYFFRIIAWCLSVKIYLSRKEEAGPIALSISSCWVDFGCRHSLSAGGREPSRRKLLRGPPKASRSHRSLATSSPINLCLLHAYRDLPIMCLTCRNLLPSTLINVTAISMYNPNLD